ncbi:MAG: type II toxin-antitoxin system RelE/ParE family toxin [Synergistaceae bacterium]|nr:type II toxin-antitoxin system RelE/ParE family toxin [Synergistaceae bacterium]
MACRLLIAEDAEDDIDGIIGYMVNYLQSPAAASSFISKLEAYYGKVLSNPRMYPLCEDVFLSSKGYRKVAVDNYIVLYRLYGDDAAIISRVFYGRHSYADII